MYFQIYMSGLQWYWRLKAANNQIVAHGEGYFNKSDCLHAINLVRGTNQNTPIYEPTS